MSGKLIIISGPAGVGKSTTAKYLAKGFEKSACIEGDVISHMSIAGRELPWISVQANELIWSNIRDLTRNFLANGCDVVVEWVVFYDELIKYMAEFLDKDIEVRYVILWADEEIHLNRDRNRPIEVQMGERVLILRNEFVDSGVSHHYYLDNTVLSIEEASHIIMSEPRFIIG